MSVPELKEASSSHVHVTSTRASGGRSSHRLRPPSSTARVAPWRWNWRLVGVTLLVVGCGVPAAVASYLYHSKEAAETFRQRAASAAAAGQFDEQLKWLQRYSLLRPDDLEGVAELARAADAAADQADSQEYQAAVSTARRQLGLALARLGSESPDSPAIPELRARLIVRLLQTGDVWFREAERQVLQLEASPGDAEATKWLALAQLGQVRQGQDERSRPVLAEGNDTAWQHLASQGPVAVLREAMEKSPQDIDLLSEFVAVRLLRPEALQQGATAGDRLNQQMATAAAELRRQLPPGANSRLEIVLAQFERLSDPQQPPTPRWWQAAEVAATRLRDPKTAPPVTKLPGQVHQPQPDAYWDYQLVSQAALVQANEDPERAARWFDLLLPLEPDFLDAETRESVFLNAGTLAAQQGDVPRAVTIWEQGLAEVDAESLSLLGAVATVRSQAEGDLPLAEQTVDRFEEAIRSASVRLAGPVGGQMSRVVRAQYGRQIEVATWRLDLLHANLAIRGGEEAAAIGRLAAAVESSTEVSPGERARAAQQLAGLYQQQGAWDQAAIVLEQALRWTPEDGQTRTAAIEAWQRAGNTQRASELWQDSESDRSRFAEVARAEASLQHQLRLPPEDRDLSGIRAMLERLQQPPASTEEGSPPRDEALERRIAWLEVLLPPSGTDFESFVASQQLAHQITDFGAARPSDTAVQTAAAVRLARLGEKEAAEQVLQRLQQTVGPTATVWVVASAEVESILGDPLAAAQKLLDQVAVDRDAEVRLRSSAAELALRGDDVDMAYRALAAIPEPELTRATLFSLAKLARQLPEEGAVMAAADAESPLLLSRAWEDRLREEEGEEGTAWRFLQATRWIDELGEQVDRGPLDKARLQETRQLVESLLRRRPSWGEAISLEGHLLAIEGRSARAVEALRRGIAAGDALVQTRLRLAEQLVRLQRYEEAEAELERVAGAAGPTVDPYATARIELSIRQRDFEHSLEVAERGRERRPDDPFSHVVLALTAAAAASAEPPEASEKRETLLERARAALAEARRVGEGIEPALFATQLRIAVVASDRAAVETALEAIQASPLEERTKLRLLADGQLALRDYAAALELLRRADAIEPTVAIPLRLAELYQRLRRPEEAIAALRKAHARQPEHPEIRNRLARALATSDTAPPNWKELEELLSDNPHATSSNRFLDAILRGTKGTENQQQEAVEMLRQLIAEENRYSEDASRFLATLLEHRAENFSDPDAAIAAAWLNEARALYESLVQRREPAVSDLYRYALFLLERGAAVDLAKVENLLTRLQGAAGGEVLSLQVALRIDAQQGNETEAPATVRRWFDQLPAKGSLTPADAAMVAGSALLERGFGKQGIVWIERVYEEDPKRLTQCVVALVKGGELDHSLELTTRHFQMHYDVNSAVLLVETLLRDPALAEQPRFQMLVSDALARYPEHPALLESVATLRLQQQAYGEAVTLYREVLKLAPLRVRALNNLAMALSELPDQAAEGLTPIDQALQIAGEIPELLDTKGVVLLRAGRAAESAEIFRTVVAASPEPRFRLHLVMALLAQNLSADAEQIWETLDLESLDRAGLTVRESQQLAALEQTFGS